MSGRYTRGLRIRTKCETIEALVAWFHRFCEDAAIFIATTTPRPEGLDTAFSVDLANGEPALAGEGVVVKAWTGRNNRFKAPGMQIGIRSLTKPSERVFERMLIARAVAQDEKTPLPPAQSWDDGTEVSAPSFDDVLAAGMTAQAVAPAQEQQDAVPDQDASPNDTIPSPAIGKHTLLGIPAIPSMMIKPATPTNGASKPAAKSAAEVSRASQPKLGFSFSVPARIGPAPAKRAAGANTAAKGPSGAPLIIVPLQPKPAGATPVKPTPVVAPPKPPPGSPIVIATLQPTRVAPAVEANPPRPPGAPVVIATVQTKGGSSQPKPASTSPVVEIRPRSRPSRGAPMRAETPQPNSVPVLALSQPNAAIAASQPNAAIAASQPNAALATSQANAVPVLVPSQINTAPMVSVSSRTRPVAPQANAVAPQAIVAPTARQATTAPLVAIAPEVSTAPQADPVAAPQPIVAPTARLATTAPLVAIVPQASTTPQPRTGPVATPRAAVAGTQTTSEIKRPTPVVVIPAEAASPDGVASEPVSARVPRAATELGSGPVPRMPARSPFAVNYDADLDDDPGSLLDEPPTQERLPSSPAVPVELDEALAVAPADSKLAAAATDDDLPVAPNIGKLAARAIEEQVGAAPRIETTQTEAKPLPPPPEAPTAAASEQPHVLPEEPRSRRRRRALPIAMAAIAVVCIAGAGIYMFLASSIDPSSTAVAAAAPPAEPIEMAWYTTAAEPPAPMIAMLANADAISGADPVAQPSETPVENAARAEPTHRPEATVAADVPPVTAKPVAVKRVVVKPPPRAPVKRKRKPPPCAELTCL